MKLSLGYNEASNFSPSKIGVDPYGVQYAPPVGNTKDYTLQLRFLNDKLSIRVTKFKTVQQNVPVGSFNASSAKMRLSRAMNGMMVETWNNGTSTRKPTTPEWIVNKWFFGDSYDKTIANTPLPTGWDVTNHPELLTQPLRVRAAAATTPNDGTVTEPLVSPDEVAYRLAWFKAQPDSAWYRPFGLELFQGLGFRRDYGGNSGFWPETTPPNLVGNGNQTAKGTEFDITINPTPNWRVSMNASESRAANTDPWGGLTRYINEFSKTAFDGWDRTVPRGSALNYWQRKGFLRHRCLRQQRHSDARLGLVPGCVQPLPRDARLGRQGHRPAASLSLERRLQL
jgi:hypothetical protein